MPTPRLLSLRIAVGIAAISFGGILIRLAGDASPIAIAAWRLALTAAVLLPIAAAKGTLRTLPRRDVLLSIGSGIALALHFVLWITSFRYTSVSSSVLFVSTHPIFVGLGAHFVLRERVSRSLVFGIALAVLGGGLIGLGDLRLGGGAVHGDLLALAGGLAVAVYFLIGRHVRRTVSLLDYVAITYGTAAILVLAAAVVTGAPLLGFTPRTYLFLGLLALGPQLIGHSTFNWALKHLPASTVSILILGEPIGATLLAIPFFREVPTWPSAVGAVIILAGIYLSRRIKEDIDESR